MAILQNIRAYLHDDWHQELFSLSDEDAQMAVDEVWKVIFFDTIGLYF